MNYLILHIRKIYENGRDITDMIENQEPFNFDSSAPKHKISTNIVTMETSPLEKLEVKHENSQYKSEYEAELQLCLIQKFIIALIWGKHTHFNFGNAKQAYSI